MMNITTKNMAQTKWYASLFIRLLPHTQSHCRYRHSSRTNHYAVASVKPKMTTMKKKIMANTVRKRYQPISNPLKIHMTDKDT